MIEFLSIKDAGDIDKERVVFRVTEDGDIGKWMLLCVEAIPENKERNLTNNVIKAYWFADTMVSKNDLAVVYSKYSTTHYKLKESNNSGRKTHFFYWDQENPVWNKSKTALLYGMFSGWKSHIVHSDEISDDIEPLDGE